MNYFASIIFFLIIVPSSLLFGQDKFAELSAKERIALAEEEESHAVLDSEFQGMMQAGHMLFKDRHYLKAIHSYENAQDIRPFNVYPKVIIADIELSMKDTLAMLRAAENSEKPGSKDDKKIDKPKPHKQKNEETRDDRMQKMDNWEDKEREKLKHEREQQKQKSETPKVATSAGDVPKLSVEEFQEDLAREYPNGISEEISTEGNKTIIKRIVVKKGKGNEYKKVVHNWGGVFYFKNGEAVTDRVWSLETEE